MWWRLEVSDGSFLLITLTKPEKPQGSMKVMMVPSLWKEPLRSWQTYLERQQSSQMCGTLSVWEHWPESRGPGKWGSYLETIMQTPTQVYAHVREHTHTHTHTHTRSHTHTKKTWGDRCTAVLISKWPLIIVAVLEQCPQFVCIIHQQKSILST